MMILRTTLALSLSSVTIAQWLDEKPLGSCADIGCPPPTDDGIAESDCKVANQTYKNVGVATFPSPDTNSSSSQNLTWTVGFHDYTDYDPDERLERTIEKAFFLGTPENMNTEFQGCAVLMESNTTTWDGNKPWDQFSCDRLIGEDCHDELLEQTEEFARGQAGNSTRGNSTDDSCAKLRGYLTSAQSNSTNRDSKCKAWNKFEVIPLTGALAPDPLTEKQNSSSNCYPTEPKSNDLTLVTSWNNTGTMYFNDTKKMVNSVNVALTVYWKEESSGVVDLKTNVNCLVPVDETTRSRETQSSGDDEDSAGVRVGGSLLGLLGALAVAMWGLL